MQMNKTKAPIRTPNEIQEIIELWKLSGQSKMAFSQEMGINYQTFVGWTKARSRNNKVFKQDKFIPIEIAKVPTPFAEVQFCSGIKLIFHQVVSPEYFQKILV